MKATPALKVAFIKLVSRLVTMQDFADILKVHVRTLRRWRRKRLVPQPDFVFGNFVRWSPETIIRWQKSHVQKPRR